MFDFLIVCAFNLLLLHQVRDVSLQQHEAFRSMINIPPDHRDEAAAACGHYNSLEDQRHKLIDTVIDSCAFGHGDYFGRKAGGPFIELLYLHIANRRIERWERRYKFYFSFEIG